MNVKRGTSVCFRRTIQWNLWVNMKARKRRRGPTTRTMTRYSLLGKLTVTPSKLVFLSASRKSFSHKGSLYLKSATVWFLRKWRILLVTCCIASATAHIPSYVYPWNLEYSLPLIASYSTWYSSGVWEINGEQYKKIATFVCYNTLYYQLLYNYWARIFVAL